jgi:hypothetical protein
MAIQEAVVVPAGGPAAPNFSDLGTDQRKTIAWRFAAANNSYLPSGVTLTGAPTVTVTDAAGADPNPSNVLIGSASITTYGSDPASTVIEQQIGNGVDGADYLFDVHCDQSDGDVAETWNHMRCWAAS